MIEPGIAPLVAALSVDWSAYRPCRVCGAGDGRPCISRYAYIDDGRPGGPPVRLTAAHAHRRKRARPRSSR